MNSISKIIVEINGNPLKDFEDVSISQNMYGIDSFEIVCRFESIEKIDEFLIESSKDFLGMPIVIQTKTEVGDKEQDCLFFKGYVTEVQGRRTGMSDNDQIVISGGSEEIILNRKPTSRAFNDKTLDEIVKDILKPYPIKSKVKSREKQRFLYVVQYEESDLEFLKRLSIRYGEWFFFNGKEIIFGEIPETEQALTVGYNLDEFNYELRVNPVKFNLSAVSPLENKLHKYKSGSSAVTGNMNVYGKHAFKQSKQLFPEEGNDFYDHLNVNDSDYKNTLEKVGEVDEIKDAINLSDLNGSSTNPSLTPGMQVMINSPKAIGTETVGYGRHLITSVHHSFNNILRYQNSFTAIPAESTIPENTNPNYIKKSGTEIAIIKDNRDPEKLGRLKVKFCWMEKNQTTPWVRLTTPYVGIKWGFYFVPPKNALVNIDFEGGDVERPYCTGAFFDKQAKPDPDWTGNYREQDASKHVIRTSAGHTLEFEDVTNSSGKIKIYNADNDNYITLDNENGMLSIHANGKLKMSGDKIEMIADSGISIQSNEGIEITAGKTIEATIGTDLEVTVGGNSSNTIGGSLSYMVSSSIKIESGTSYDITVGTSTSITSGASMTFTSPIIKIN